MLINWLVTGEFGEDGRLDCFMCAKIGYVDWFEGEDVD